MNRAVELLITGLAGLLALPFFLIAYVILRLSLGAPSVFRQTRSGLHDVPFTVIKLRTMSDARAPDGALLPDAQRQTPISTIVRRLRLDELPQLLTILRGEMALVGPRPLLRETIAGFGQDGLRRATVRPGLTGWAQVSGNTMLSDTEKLQLDLWYIANRSTWLDLRILAETIGVALYGEQRRVDRIALVSKSLTGSATS
ncbi:sugar transferase [uncultured Tateyamaria sp.]|uniref:sugar transferase n=1 Tax=uncultured Tateyamaria sp. TaxID=455651 RepID=UPI00260D66E7|nr:sugar transferase [uncultured Tateyamaria sp.]